VRPPDEDVRFPTSYGDVALPVDAVTTIVQGALGSNQPANLARDVVRSQLINLAWDTYVARQSADVSLWAAYTDAVRASATFKKALDRVWPTVSAVDVIRKLYGNSQRLRRASEGVLDDHERRLLARKPTSSVSREAWTTADLALLDEAEALLNGLRRRYGHIVIDEAQDLSAMELRMIGRRAHRKSMTVLGDLAQATAPGAQTSWDDLGDELGVRTNYAELTVGYRVPAPILRLANALLATAAPEVRPTTSVRVDGAPPQLVSASVNDLPDTIARYAALLTDTSPTLAVVTPESLLDLTAGALQRGDIAYSDGQRTLALGEHVTLLLPTNTKGLEFDSVLVIEPSRIVGEHHHGQRLLYITLTRAVQQLVIIHTEGLPDGIADPPGVHASVPSSDPRSSFEPSGGIRDLHRREVPGEARVG
jgi:DNA helicase IV